MENIQTKTFIEKLTELMDKNEVSRKKLAEGTGIPRSTIDNWFNRNENDPKKEVLIAIAKFFKVSLYYLCDDTCLEDPTVNKKNPFAKYLSDGELLAFHLDGNIDASDLTENEIQEVIKFIKYVKSTRTNESTNDSSNKD